MYRFLRIVFHSFVVGLILGGGAGFAQDAATPAADRPYGPHPAALSRELELEKEVYRLKVAKLEVEAERDALRAQLGAMSQSFNNLLAASTKPKVEALNTEGKRLHDEIVRWFGGDPEKGDTLTADMTALAPKDAADPKKP